MKKLLLIILINTAAFAENPYKKILIETLKIAQDLMSLPPKGTVLVKSNQREFHITKENVDTPLDRHNNFPIHYAAQSGNLNDVVQLISFGSSINKRNNWNQTPLMKAVQGANVLNVGYLLKTGAELSQEQNPTTRFNPFHYAAIPTNDIKAMIAILNILAQFDQHHHFINMDSRRGTPLELAIRSGTSPEIIKTLLQNGAHLTRKALSLSKKKPALKMLLETYEPPISALV